MAMLKEERHQGSGYSKDTAGKSIGGSAPSSKKKIAARKSTGGKAPHPNVASAKGADLNKDRLAQLATSDYEGYVELKVLFKNMLHS